MNSLDVISLLRNTDGCVGRRSTHRVPTEADEWSEPVDEYSVTQDERVARKDEYCPHHKFVRPQIFIGCASILLWDSMKFERERLGPLTTGLLC